MPRKNDNAARARNKDREVARQERRMLAALRHAETLVAGPLSKNLVVMQREHEYR